MVDSSRGAFAALVLLSLASSGCAHFQFGSYESFDAWYSAGKHPFDPEVITVGLPERCFAGYLVQDVAMRAPVFALYDLGRIAVSPIAAPYYAVKCVAGEKKTAEPWSPVRSYPASASPPAPTEAGASPAPADADGATSPPPEPVSPDVEEPATDEPATEEPSPESPMPRPSSESSGDGPPADDSN